MYLTLGVCRTNKAKRDLDATKEEKLKQAKEVGESELQAAKDEQIVLLDKLKTIARR